MSEEETRDDIIDIVNNNEETVNEEPVKEEIKEEVKEEVKEEIKPKAKPKAKAKAKPKIKITKQPVESVEPVEPESLVAVEPPKEIYKTSRWFIAQTAMNS